MNDVKGYLVAIGGAEDKGEETADEQNSVDFLENGILKQIVGLTGKQAPTIEIITTATSYPIDTYTNYKKAFESLGCLTVGHLNIRDRAAANSEETVERVNKCNAVFFSGGDQARLCAVIGGTKLHERVRDRYLNEPFIIAGTSAGAAAMSNTMINGGKVQRAYLKGEVRLSLGLGFIHDVIIGTHFDARGRFARLAQAVAAQPGIVGIGLSEDTGVIIQNDRLLKAIGSSGVTIIEGSGLGFNSIAEVDDGVAISVGKLGVYLIAHNDEFDINSQEYKRAS